MLHWKGTREQWSIFGKTNVALFQMVGSLGAIFLFRSWRNVWLRKCITLGLNFGTFCAIQQWIGRKRYVVLWLCTGSPCSMTTCLAISYSSAEWDLWLVLTLATMEGSLQLHDHDSGTWQPVCNYIAALQVVITICNLHCPFPKRKINREAGKRSQMAIVILQLTTIWDSLNVNNWNYQNCWNHCSCMTCFMTALLNADYQVQITVVN